MYCIEQTIPPADEQYGFLTLNPEDFTSLERLFIEKTNKCLGESR
jgi:hypothetical protein